MHYMFKKYSMYIYNIHVYYIHILKDELCIQIFYIWKNHVLSICKYLNNWHPRVFQTLTHKGVSTSVSAQVREKKNRKRVPGGMYFPSSPYFQKLLWWGQMRKSLLWCSWCWTRESSMASHSPGLPAKPPAKMMPTMAVRAASQAISFMQYNIL